jgi:ureidoglycolate dehydrogenase (NAD+)
MTEIKQDVLRELSNKVLVLEGMPAKIAEEVTECLIESSLRGVDSHGIRLLPHYVDVIRSGRINKNPQITIDQSAASTAILDADHTFGHYAASLAIKKSMDMATVSGAGFVSVKNSTHCSAMSYYSLQAARKGMIGFGVTHSTSMMVPTNGKEPYLGTNAITFAFPCFGEDPVCLDMATTQLAWNKVLRAKESGQDLDAAWAVDKHGVPTKTSMDATGLLPTGLHKGFGFGLVVEALCATLTGGPYGPNLVGMFELSTLSKKRQLSHFVGAIDISKFINIDFFMKNMSIMVSEIRKTKPIEGETPVLVAGDPEKIIQKDRETNGIPLDDHVVAKFRDLSKNHNLNYNF